MASIEETFPGGVHGTALTGLAVLGLLVVTHVVVPHWSTRYGAGLAVFTVWMTWFVVTFVRWLADADF